MTPIEKQALALINEVLASSGYRPIALTEAERWFPTTFPAIISAIERHEAFRQEVSDAVGNVCAALRKSPDGNVNGKTALLERFIIPAPADPLVEAMQDAAIGAAAAMGLKLTGYNVEQEAADRLRKALAARNLEITEKKP